MSTHDYRDLTRLFNTLFECSFNTVLVRGEGEPEYLPADARCARHRIIFAHGFFSSALHEVSHWCLAGAQRRTQVDFGYWYKPDGRTAQEQALFETVEVKPQALEWIFSVACGHRFHFSADNLSADIGASRGFEARVQQQVLHYLEAGLPARADMLVEALQSFYGTDPLQPASFRLEPRPATLPHPLEQGLATA
ncbi:elongation factor P hydroxylase [Marinobacterium rhizophilum]|uniref:Elongation factor P hydroxylase n=1 Tax=Marinobacterium rhizophilum TaxID=420402 RepID=A0ABY5HMG0_9GAMM|nr:elongation factor P hydroxylase [Marinobacterium rhizophilum]UTW13591.1 elongation factor P hydroxylase [Marinobacterium rhizophilum]